MWWTARRPRVEIPRALPGIVAILQEAMAAVAPLSPVSLYAGGRGRTSPEFAYSPQGLAEVEELFDRWLSGRLVVRLEAPPAEVPAPRALSVSFQGRQDDVWNGFVTVSAGAPWCDERASDLDRCAEAWADALGRVMGVCGAGWGCVSLDHWQLQAPPYDLYHGSWREGEPAFDRHPRGYYWVNVLNPVHVDLLGGVSEFDRRAQAGGLTVRELAGTGGEPLYLLRDPAPVSAFTDARLHAVHDVLEAALLKPDYLWYEGPPLRVVKQAGTAFRPIPADVARPVFDDDESWPEEG